MMMVVMIVLVLRRSAVRRVAGVWLSRQGADFCRTTSVVRR